MDERGGAFRSEAPFCFSSSPGPFRRTNDVGRAPVLSIVMKTPLGTLGSGRLETAHVDARERDFPRPVLVSDEALAEQCLIQEIRAGDRAAFGTLVEGYLPRAMALAVRILRNREDSEDLV